MAQNNDKISALLDRDVYKKYKQIQLDHDLKSISQAMRFDLERKAVKTPKK